MQEDTLGRRMGARPTLSLVLMMMFGFCLLIVTGVPQQTELTKILR
jgi:hypothetical protein